MHMYKHIGLRYFIHASSFSLAKADRRSSQVKDQPRKTVKCGRGSKFDPHPRATTIISALPNSLGLCADHVRSLRALVLFDHVRIMRGFCT